MMASLAIADSIAWHAGARIKTRQSLDILRHALVMLGSWMIVAVMVRWAVRLPMLL